jgi:hypothetical protein
VQQARLRTRSRRFRNAEEGDTNRPARPRRSTQLPRRFSIHWPRHRNAVTNAAPMAPPIRAFNTSRTLHRQSGGRAYRPVRPGDRRHRNRTVVRHGPLCSSHYAMPTRAAELFLRPAGLLTAERGPRNDLTARPGRVALRGAPFASASCRHQFGRGSPREHDTARPPTPAMVRRRLPMPHASATHAVDKSLTCGQQKGPPRCLEEGL